MIAGIFVGGKSRRMGGKPKGRLLARDTGEPLVVRTSRLLRSLAVTPVLVGESEAYADLLPGVLRLRDQPSGVGPLGGLAALLFAAQGEHVIAVACDMPFLSSALLEKLTHTGASEDVLAAKGTAGFWEPFCARYRVASVSAQLVQALAAQEHSFRALFQRLNVAELALNDGERSELADWDTADDMRTD